MKTHLINYYCSSDKFFHRFLLGAAILKKTKTEDEVDPYVKIIKNIINTIYHISRLF
jgi:thiamine kinase-like enzyme